MRTIAAWTFSLLGLVMGQHGHRRETSNGDFTIGQTVQTDSGAIHGHASALAPEVSEYLGIPYAKPPIGELRFSPPQRYFTNSTINGTAFGFSCPVASTYSELLRARPDAGLNFTVAGTQILNDIAQVNDRFSEDCLSLNIWTKSQVGEKRKAVMLWIHGGGYIGGASNAPTYNGAHIANQGDVVVVSINYRLNIFGFPGAPGFGNLGLLDQRLAIEWVRDNIASFNGDPSRITIFGESAGGGAVDIYSYAWTSDPIVAGFIAQSGTTEVVPPNNASTAAALWFNVTTQLKCGDATANSQQVASCMLTKNTTQITEAISKIPNFVPVIDEKVVFSDYLERSLAGNFIKKPMLVGHTDYEGGMLDIVARLKGITVPQEYLDAFDSKTFFCPAAARTNVSVYNNIPIWRYRYFGEFPNMQLSSTIHTGAYHGAEVNVLFDTIPAGKDIPSSTSAEVEIAQYMRGAWVAFAKDPVRGLDSYGWPLFDPTKETLIRLGWLNQTGTNLASPREYDATCGSIFPVDKV